MLFPLKFDRMEFSGSLGDLGTLLPISIGMIMINGLNPLNLFFTIGLFYVLSGVFFRVTVPVQPMKVIGAYSIAMGVSAPQIFASGALMGIFLLIIGCTGAIGFIKKMIPYSVIRGVQLSTGVLLMSRGIGCIIGTSPFQVLKHSSEPFLSVDYLGSIPIGIVIGIIAAIFTFLLLENKKIPAAILIVTGGGLIGLIFGTHDGFEKLRIGVNIPEMLPFEIMKISDFTTALVLLVIPQIPMTLGNAVVAYSDLSAEYFGDASKKVTARNACISMGVANMFSFLMAGMPLCHGAGGLAAHYRFGARTAGSNLMIGSIFVILAVFLGKNILSLIHLIPFSILGVLLFFSGSQLAMTVIDVKQRKDFFVVITILGITLATNLAVGFITGILLGWALKSEKLHI